MSGYNRTPSRAIPTRSGQQAPVIDRGTGLALFGPAQGQQDAEFKRSVKETIKISQSLPVDYKIPNRPTPPHRPQRRPSIPTRDPPPITLPPTPPEPQAPISEGLFAPGGRDTNTNSVGGRPRSLRDSFLANKIASSAPTASYLSTKMSSNFRFRPGCSPVQEQPDAQAELARSGMQDLDLGSSASITAASLTSSASGPSHASSGHAHSLTAMSVLQKMSGEAITHEYFSDEQEDNDDNDDDASNAHAQGKSDHDDDNDDEHHLDDDEDDMFAMDDM